MILKLAWRNIWRNKRRTFITAASVVFAVLFATVVMSIHKGTWDNMANNVIQYYYGYIQIQPVGYSDEPSLDLAFEPSMATENISDDNKDYIHNFIPRIESFGLASSGEKTIGAMVLGVDPDLEDSMTKLSERLSEGKYFAADDKSVMVGRDLSENMNLAVGDTLVLISMGFQGSNAAGKYPVVAIVDLPSPELSKQLIYLPLKEAQYFYNAEGMVTSLALDVKDRGNIDDLVAQLESEVDNSTFVVKDWQSLMPELVEAMHLDRASSSIILIILYFIITFGIFGTILMMVKERLYEFGVMISIGFKRWKLIVMVWLEIVFIGLIGAMAGILVCLPVLWLLKVYPITMSGQYAEAYEKFGMEPVLPAVIEPSIFFLQAFIVFIVTTILAAYPLVTISKLRPIEAMRQ